MNWGMKNITGVVFEYIKNNAENLPDKYKNLMQEKPEFYEYIQKRIDQAINA
jgi:hypothetical protein